MNGYYKIIHTIGKRTITQRCAQKFEATDYAYGCVLQTYRSKAVVIPPRGFMLWGKGRASKLTFFWRGRNHLVCRPTPVRPVAKRRTIESDTEPLKPWTGQGFE